MSKELEALKEIENACLAKFDKWEGFVDVPIYTTEQFAIIEKALKAYDVLLMAGSFYLYNASNRDDWEDWYLEGWNLEIPIEKEDAMILKEAGIPEKRD